MKYLLLVLLFIAGSCCEPEIKEVEVIVHDTIDLTCYPCIDSATLAAQVKIDSYYFFKLVLLDSFTVAENNRLSLWEDSLNMLMISLEALREDFLVYSDSITTVKENEIDSLYSGAMEEVISYRESAIYQVDTMRANFLSWMDSLKNIHIHDNLIIKDTLNDAQVKFDSVIGKPYVIIN